MAKLFYENKFILTGKLHAEYFRHCFKKLQKETQIMSLILAILSLAVSAVVMIFFRNVLFTSLFAVLSLYFIFMIFFGYTFRQWIDYRRLTDEHGDVLVTIVSFFSDRVKVKVNKTELYFKYSTIDSAYETEDSIILLLKAPGMTAHGQLLFKPAFKEEGGVEGFKKFLNQKTGKELFPEEEA